MVTGDLWHNKQTNRRILNDIGRNSLPGNRKKIAKFLMRTFACRSSFLYAWGVWHIYIRGSYLWWNSPKARLFSSEFFMAINLQFFKIPIYPMLWRKTPWFCQLRQNLKKSAISVLKNQTKLWIQGKIYSAGKQKTRENGVGKRRILWWFQLVKAQPIFSPLPHFTPPSTCLFNTTHEKISGAAL